MQGAEHTRRWTDEQRKVIKEMHRHLRDGNVTRARNVLNRNGLFNLQTREGSTLLSSKHPTNEIRKAEGAAYLESEDHTSRADRTTAGGGLDIQEATDALTRNINSRHRNASRSTTGHSNDNYKAIIQAHPQAARDLVLIADRVIGGALIDGNARADFVRGKGTALRKGSLDLRPIVTLHPINNYAALLLIKLVDSDLKTAVGESQLCLEKGGVEGNGHGV
jgi:hypothetical protein